MKKVGSGTLTLSGANTYSGGTTVSAGALSLAAANALRANSTLTVSNGAVVGLDYSGTITLISLELGGVSQGGGTYGATGSGADHINDTYFTGTGLILVSGAAPNATIIWTASVNNSWDDGTVNWTNGSFATTWYNSASGPNSAIFTNLGVGSVNMSFLGTFYANSISFDVCG